MRVIEPSGLWPEDSMSTHSSDEEMHGAPRCGPPRQHCLALEKASPRPSNIKGATSEVLRTPLFHDLNDH